MLVKTIIVLCCAVFLPAALCDQPRKASNKKSNQQLVVDGVANLKNLVTLKDVHKRKPRRCRKSSNSSSHHHRKERCCPKTRIAKVKNLSGIAEQLMTNYSFGELLNYFSDTAEIFLSSAICSLAPNVGACCYSTMSIVSFLDSFGIPGTYSFYFVNQNPPTPIILPDGELQYTTVLVAVNNADNSVYVTEQLEIIWSKLPWCCDFKISQIKISGPGCTSDVTLPCTSCIP